MPLMENSLHPAPVTDKPFEAGNPTFNGLHPSEGVNLVCYPIRIVQDALTDNEEKLRRAMWYAKGHIITPAGSHIVRIGTAALMALTGFCYDTVRDLIKSLRSKLVMRMVKREHPWTCGAQTYEIFHFKQIKATWKQNGWVNVIKNRGRRFANALHELVVLEVPALPKLVRDVLEIFQNRRTAKAYVAPPPPPQEVQPQAVAATVNQETAVLLWQCIQSELKFHLEPRRFDMWIRPVRGWDLIERVLYIELPSSAFKHIRDEWRTEIEAAIRKQNLAVDRIEYTLQIN